MGKRQAARCPSHPAACGRCSLPALLGPGWALVQGAAPCAQCVVHGRCSRLQLAGAARERCGPSHLGERAGISGKVPALPRPISRGSPPHSGFAARAAEQGEAVGQESKAVSSGAGVSSGGGDMAERGSAAWRVCPHPPRGAQAPTAAFGSFTSAWFFEMMSLQQPRLTCECGCG